MRRRLATIMVGDIVDSTAQMGADEERSVRRFEECLNSISETIRDHEGRVFNRAGDSVLAEFNSPVNALRSAMTARTAIGSRQSDPRTDIRFGLHLADVIEIDGDLRGDGVNIAARIQASADPGSIDASGTLFDQVRRISPYLFDDLGAKTFAGVSDPIHVYRVRDQMAAHRMQISAPPAHPRVIEKRAHSIAVAPLASASSAGEDQRFLAEGLTEDLILEIGRLHQLFVISSTASMGLAGRDPISIGQELGVRYVLTGSMRALGTHLRLNLTLAETSRGETVWAQKIQRPFDEFVDMIDDICAQVAGTVLGRVLDADTKIARMKPPETLTAYEHYLRGLDYHRLGGVTDANILKAMEWFEKSIAADPSFARAQAMWVCSASSLKDYDWDNGRAVTSRALELDPNDPEANRIMGTILLKERKYDAARVYHERAMEVAPNNAYMIGRCAAFYNFTGDPEKALELLEHASSLDPYLPPWITEERIVALYNLQRYEDTLKAARDLPFQTRRSRIYRAAARVAMDDLAAAKQIITEACAETSDVNLDFVHTVEIYQDRQTLELLSERLKTAGLSAD